MPAPPTSRRDILRAVYEENLRVSTPEAPRRERPVRPSAQRSEAEPPSPAPRAARRAWIGWSVLFLLLAVGAVAWGIELVSGGADEAPVAQGSAPSLAPSEVAPRPTIRPLRTDPALLPVAELFGLRVSTIVLDPGHGGRDPGAVGAGGTYEKDVTLDLALRLRDRIHRRTGYRVLLTRETDVSVPLRERVRFANDHAADLFVSIHLNSIPDARAAPIETYYFGMQADAATLELAHGENAAGDYSVAEFNDLMRRAGSTLKFQESHELARTLQSSLIRHVRGAGTRASDWGVKSGPFLVLLGVDAPAVLAEVAALSNPAHETSLASDAYRDELVRALEEGLIDYLKHRSPQAPTAPLLYGTEEES